MNKPLALLFSIFSAVLLIGVAAALSYRQLGWALLLLLAYLAFVAFGFITKARMRKKKDSNS